MKGTTEKWVEGVSPADRVEEVAARTLENRLGAVLHYLPLAAEKAEEDREYVHQLRVWVRRATAALRLYAPLLPKRRSRWIRKKLKRVRLAANDARDCDVLVQRLRERQISRGAQRWMASALQERAKAQKAVLAIHERLDPRFSRRLDKFVAKVRERGAKHEAHFGTWAHAHLRPVVEQFFLAVPADQSDEVALHHFRIRGKELRYCLEMLAGAFPEALRIELYPVVEEIQDRLGDINDLATAKTRLQQKINEDGDRAQASSWRRLLVTEQRHLDGARQAFWDWCSPKMLHDLRDRFEAVVCTEREKNESKSD